MSVIAVYGLLRIQRLIKLHLGPPEGDPETDRGRLHERSQVRNRKMTSQASSHVTANIATIKDIHDTSSVDGVDSGFLRLSRSTGQPQYAPHESVATKRSQERQRSR